MLTSFYQENGNFPATEDEVGFAIPDPAVAPGRLGSDLAIGPSPGRVALGSASSIVGTEIGMGSSVGVGSASIGLPVADGFKRPSERRKQMRSLQPNGRLVAAVGAGEPGIGLPVAGGFKRPSERRKQMRSLQPNGRLVAVVGAGESKRLSESTTQSRESHVRGSVEDAETGKIADVDGVVPIAGVVRGFKSPGVPGSLGVGLKVQSVSQSGQRLGSKETAGGGGSQCGKGNPGGGGCNGIIGLRGGSGAGGIHGLLGVKGGNGGGGIHGLLGFTGDNGGGGIHGLLGFTGGNGGGGIHGSLGFKGCNGGGGIHGSLGFTGGNGGGGIHGLLGFKGCIGGGGIHGLLGSM